MHQRPSFSARRQSPPPGQPALHVSIFAKAPLRGLLRFRSTLMSGKAALQLVAEVPLRPMTPALVLFGRDDAGRPRAAWFDASEAKLAAQAAEVMNLRVVQLADDEQRAFADQLTHGRLFGSGRAFIPYIRRELFPASSNSPAFRWIQTARTRPLPPRMARPRQRKSRGGERCPARRRQPLCRPLRPDPSSGTSCPRPG